MSELTFDAGKVAAIFRRGVGTLRLRSSLPRSPGDARELVGERDRQHVVVQALRCRRDPGLETMALPSSGPEQHGAGGLEEQRAQVLIPSFGNLAEDGAIAGGDLLRDEAKPGAEVAAPLEKASPVPMAATVALEMMGPMPGTVIRRSQAGSS